ncbi:MAG: putative symporter YjmB [Firmicutes bacterium ADurb.Bin153]|nr:MAG: putative symporter YjmB [Firmicutes bacterium ADurb.Bin153]
MSVSKGKAQLTTLQRICYGAGESSATLANTTIGFFFLFFMTDVIGLAPALAGAVVMIGNIWDAVTDPFVGWLSDRSHNRFGRRRVWILGSAIPLGITFALIWSSPGSALGQWATFAYYTAFYMAYIFVITSFMVPYTTLGMELTNDYDERTSLAMWRMIFNIGLSLPATVLPKILVDMFEQPKQGYFTMGWIIGAAIMLFPFLVIFAGRERPMKTDDTPFFKSFVESLKFRPFRQAVLMYIFAWLPIKLLMAVMLYYFKYYLNMARSFELAMGIMMVVATLALPFWNYLSGRLDKRRAYMVGLASFSLMIMVLLLPKTFLARLLPVIAFLIGFTVSSMHIMPVAIVPEAIDAGIAAGVPASEGIWNGVVTFVQKTSSALAIFMIGVVLDLVGYNAGAAVQTNATLVALKVLVAVVPALLTVLGIIVASGFRIGRGSQAAEKAGAR